MDHELYRRLRKRMLMFYFAAGVNLVMSLWVLSVGSGSAAGGTLAIVVLIFFAFAAINFYMARLVKKQWDTHLRQQQGGSDAVTK